MSSDLDQNKKFNYSLYHHIAHWAAYVATMGVLLTMGFFLCLTPLTVGRPHRDEQLWVVTVIVIASFLAAVYFAIGMNSYGRAIIDELPSGYHQKITPHRRHKLIIAATVAAAVLMASIDLLVLWCWQ